MTFLTMHTPATSTNAILTAMSLTSTNKNKVVDTTYSTYSVSSKNIWSKSNLKLSSIDWDLNMNELEFE